MGLFSGIKKLFKKVTNVVKKVAPLVLLAGAAIFTGGAALGLAPFAGGWGAAAAGMTNALGLGGTTLGSVVSGAITQAGYGALAGGGMSLLTGGDPLKGAQMGALGGALTGGVMGGLGFATDPLGGAFSGQTGGQSVAAGGGMATQGTPLTTQTAQLPNLGPASTGAAGSVSGTTQGGFGVAGKATGVNVAGSSAPAASGGAPAVTPAAASSGGFSSFLKDNQFLVGNAIQGLGAAFAPSEAEDLAELERQRAERDAASYAGLQATPLVNDTTERPTPKQAYGSRRRYMFNRQTGQIEERTA